MMILDKEVEINITPRNVSYYKNFSYNSVIGKKILVNIENLPHESHVKINVVCDNINCVNKNKEKKVSYGKYIKNTNNLTKLYCCCQKCAYDSGKNKETNLKRYGVSMPIYNIEIQEKSKQTCRKNNGTDYPAQNSKIYDKKKITMLKNYNVEYSFQSETLKNKTKQTCLEKYGVEHPMQNHSVWRNQQKNSCKVKIYKNTNLTYQGSYELYFLEQIEKKDLLNQISKGKSYNYILNDKKHVYYSDYWFNNSIIEIKSGWTYNKNGKDNNLELENETKWQAVKNNGDNIIVLMSKIEIKNYIKNLK